MAHWILQTHGTVEQDREVAALRCLVCPAWPNNSTLLAGLLHEICKFLQISSITTTRVRPSIPLLAATNPYEKIPWGEAGNQLEQIIVLRAQRNSTTQRRSTLKRLCCRSSLSLRQRQLLCSLWTEYILYCRSQGLLPQLRGTGEWKAGGTA